MRISKTISGVVMLGMVTMLSAAMQPRHCLVELCSMTGCGPCQIVYQLLEDMKNQYPEPDLVCVRYHPAWDEHGNSETYGRIVYYQPGSSHAYPTVAHNGQNVLTGAGIIPQQTPSIIASELAETTPFSVDVKLFLKFNKAIVTTKVKLHEPYSGQAPVLRVVLKENDIGPLFTDLTCRIVDSDQITISNTGQTHTVQETFTLEYDWNAYNLQAVSFIQVDETKEVLQVNVADPEFSKYFGKISAHTVVCIHDTEPDYAIVAVAYIDIAWEDPYWWIKHPYDPWPPYIYPELQIGYTSLKPGEDVVGVEDSYMINVNLDFRYQIPLGWRTSLFVGAGPGYYRVGDDNEFGFNGLAGIDFMLAPRLGLELGGNYHFLFDEANTQFAQVGAGLFYRF